MPEQANQYDWLETVISPSSVALAFILLIIIVVFLLAFSEPFRSVFRGRNLKLGIGDKILESSPAYPSVQEPAEESGTALARPPVTEEDDSQPEIPDAIPDNKLPLAEDDEPTLHYLMWKAGREDRDPAKIEAAYQKMRALKEREVSDENLEVFRVNMRLRAGVDTGQDELIKLEQENSTWLRPSIALVRLYEALSRSDLARPHAEKAIERSDNDDDKTDSYIVLADVLVNQGSQKEALNILNSALAEVAEDEAKTKVLDKIAELHEAENDGMGAAKALEQALILIPNDKTRRFNLAYGYANIGNQHMALYHYRILTKQDPEFASAMNNLGVVYDKLKLPGKCITSWRRAANSGEAHSVGNIAINQIKSGFHDEARKILDDVPSEQIEDPQIVEAKSLLKSINDQEDTVLDKHLNASEMRHKFMLLAVEAEQDSELMKLGKEDLIGNWTSGTSTAMKLDLPQGRGLMTSEKLHGELTETVGGGALSGLLMAPSPPTQNKYSIYLSKNGLVITGTAFPSEENPSTALWGAPENREFFLVATGKNEMRGIYWTEIEKRVEISFKRS